MGTPPSANYHVGGKHQAVQGGADGVSLSKRKTQHKKRDEKNGKNLYPKEAWLFLTDMEE